MKIIIDEYSSNSICTLYRAHELMEDDMCGFGDTPIEALEDLFYSNSSLIEKLDNG